MGFTHVLLALAGTLVCLLGFLKRPRGLYELVQPRFIVPLMIWAATFAQVFFLYLFPEPSSLYSESRYIVGTKALEYLLLCMVCFWVGYGLPLGRYVAGPLARAQSTIPINPYRLRSTGSALCILTFLVMLILGGTGFLGISTSIFVIGGINLQSAIVGPMMTVVGILGAALIGISWPDKERRTFFVVLWGLTMLFLVSTPLMASFSRGTGLPVIVAYIAYAVRLRTLPVKTGLFCVFYAGIAGYAGMSGRGVHGHYAGILPYLEQFFTDSIWSWGNAFLTAMGANDSFTPLCVSIRAVEQTYLGQFTPLDWFIFQIPIPRIFGIHPEYTMTLTYFVGGRGSWNYTATIFGDTFIHFGFAGALVFGFLGAAYRFIATLIDTTTATATMGVNPFVILTLTSYFAMAMGLFNGFRAWVVPFFYPLYIVVFFVVLLGLFRSHQSQDLQAYDQPTY